MSEHRIQTGVIGVGAMGQHHARVYEELPGCELLGVADADDSRAREIADEYDTTAWETDALFEAADAVTIAVPTAYHYELATQCLAAETNILIEKPFVDDPAEGKELIQLAADRDLVLQVGHIERFNPVTETLQQILPSLDVISMTAERLGPPPSRRIEDTAVMDLMIHDIDIVTSLLEGSIEGITASGNADGRYGTATLEFDTGEIANLTASRVTQQKVRTLEITAKERFLIVDFIDQSIEIHRQSAPEYVTEEGNMRYRHESIVEHPVVDTGEPLRFELESFLEAVRGEHEPRVTGEDGLRALSLISTVNEKAFGAPDTTVEVLQD